MRGVTLIELMTAIFVLAILLGIGIPSFTNIMRNNQIAAQSTNLVQALTFARSEAMKRGLRVSICPAVMDEDDPDDTVCSDTTNWSTGWVVFVDDFGNAGVLDPSDTPIQFWPAAADGVVITGSAASVVYMASGAAAVDRGFTVTKTGCKGDQRRVVTVAATGRVSLQRTSCADAPPPEEEDGEEPAEEGEEG